MNLFDFSPVGKQVSASRELALEYTAQRDLISVISGAASQIEASPFAKPSHREVYLGCIALKDTHGAQDPQGQLNLRFSENGDSANATIDIRTSSDVIRLRLSPSANDWGSYGRRSNVPDRVLSNESVVALLDTLLLKEGVMRPLLDTARFPAIEIPHLLTDQFSATASPKEILTTYDAFSGRISTVAAPIEFAGVSIPDYEMSVFSRLSILKTNRYTQYSASAQSPVKVGRRVVQKEYSYEFQQNNNSRHIMSAVGKIGLSSSDGYSRHELEQFIKQDSERIPESELFAKSATAVLAAHSSYRGRG